MPGRAQPYTSLSIKVADKERYLKMTAQWTKQHKAPIAIRSIIDIAMDDLNAKMNAENA